jgi:hypothetical protein
MAKAATSAKKWQNQHQRKAKISRRRNGGNGEAKIVSAKTAKA